VTVVRPSWVVPSGPADPECCLIVILLSLVRGWRMTRSTVAVTDSAQSDGTTARP
jgi:hypothetical protein